MRAKRALITGITGQDGAYLSSLLVEKGYEVHGLLRRSASSDVVDARLKWIGVADKVVLHDGNLIDLASLIRVIEAVKPTEIYNLAAQSFVKSSWQQPHPHGRGHRHSVRLTCSRAARIICPTLASTRLPHRRCMARSRSPFSLKRPHSIRDRPTPSPSSTPTG